MQGTDRFIGNIQQETTDMPFPPMVKNGYSTFCDPKRFAAEKHTLETSFLIATMAGDLADRYVQTTMNGKKR